jgi:hypothetical protein
MSSLEERICKICKKPYEFEFERTITFLEDNEGVEYVICQKCFEKYLNMIKKGVKR